MPLGLDKQCATQGSHMTKVTVQVYVVQGKMGCRCIPSCLSGYCRQRTGKPHHGHPRVSPLVGPKAQHAGRTWGWTGAVLTREAVRSMERSWSRRLSTDTLGPPLLELLLLMLSSRAAGSLAVGRRGRGL